MKVAIHQPNFLPWLGYFYKIANSEIFIFLDDTQYTKNSFINRNRIKTPQNEKWLTIPVKGSGKFGQLIKDVEIDAFAKNVRKIKNTIKTNYSKSKYFNEVYSLVEPALTTYMLSEVNEMLIINICNYLKIETKFIKSSDLNFQQYNSTERLIQLCKDVNATSYLSGFGGINYQDSVMFKHNNIKLITSDFIHPTYPQLWGWFIPNLSIIDLLFNCGSKSKEIILNAKVQN